MIITVPPKTLTTRQKQLITNKGHIIIETNEPEKVKVINTETPVDAHDYYLSALYALANNDNMHANSSFIKELYRRLKETEKINKETQQP